jgi:PAS domain S-box-containing protein
MKNTITPTRQEHLLREHDFIVSKTDLHGRITYCNEVFIEYSGYSEAELLGAQHNIIRHPDMPRGVFQVLWDTIKAGRECYAYVKNLTKDGGYYWVFANITPDLDDQGQPAGYFSVRRKPRPEAVRAIEGIYSAMLEEERKAGSRDAVAASTTWLIKTLMDREDTYERFVLSL